MTGAYFPYDFNEFGLDGVSLDLGPAIPVLWYRLNPSCRWRPAFWPEADVQCKTWKAWRNPFPAFWFPAAVVSGVTGNRGSDRDRSCSMHLPEALGPCIVASPDPAPVSVRLFGFSIGRVDFVELLAVDPSRV